MILKVTFKDNDFTQLLECFFENGEMLKRTFYSEARNTITDIDSNSRILYEMIVKDDEFEEFARDILLDNKCHVTEKHDRLIELVKEKIIIFLERNITRIGDLDQKSIEYLKSTLDVEILTSMINKWENGEICYYYYDNNKFITQ